MMPVIDTCDMGHKFAKLTDHPVRNGMARCPICIAKGLDAARVKSILFPANEKTWTDTRPTPIPDEPSDK